MSYNLLSTFKRMNYIRFLSRYSCLSLSLSLSLSPSPPLSLCLSASLTTICKHSLKSILFEGFRLCICVTASELCNLPKDTFIFVRRAGKFRSRCVARVYRVVPYINLQFVYRFRVPKRSKKFLRARLSDMSFFFSLYLILCLKNVEQSKTRG